MCALFSTLSAKMGVRILVEQYFSSSFSRNYDHKCLHCWLSSFFARFICYFINKQLNGIIYISLSGDTLWESAG